MATVMVVDDEERVRTLLAKSLSSEGHSVVTAATANAAIDRLASRDVDLVVLDLVMPGLNGLAVLDAIKRAQADDAGHRAVGRHRRRRPGPGARPQGAVDVVSKPFSLTELHRPRATQRRRRRALRADDGYLEVAGIRLDVGRRRATFAGAQRRPHRARVQPARAPHARAGQVCHKEELLHDVWHLDFDPGSNVVEVCVGRLRAKLGQDMPVETVRGVGYGLYEDVPDAAPDGPRLESSSRRSARPR